MREIFSSLSLNFEKIYMGWSFIFFFNYLRLLCICYFFSEQDFFPHWIMMFVADIFLFTSHFMYRYFMA